MLHNSIELENEIVALNLIREKIESMPKFNQVEVLRILEQNKNVTLNENKNGIHINLSELSEDIIEKMNLDSSRAS